MATQKSSSVDVTILNGAPDTRFDEALAIDLTSSEFENEFDTHYGLLAPQQTVLVRAYSDDTDDQMLWELQPKFIVMFEPNQDFVRRVEVSFTSKYWQMSFV